MKRFADSMYLPWDVLPKGAKGEIAAMKKLQDCIIVNRPVATAITPYGHDAIFPHVMDCTMQLVADTIYCFRDKKEEMETLLSTLLPPFIGACLCPSFRCWLASYESRRILTMDFMLK